MAKFYQSFGDTRKVGNNQEKAQLERIFHLQKPTWQKKQQINIQAFVP